MSFILEEDVVVDEMSEVSADFEYVFSYKSNNTDIFREIENVINNTDYQDQIQKLHFKIVMQDLLIKKYKPGYEAWNNFKVSFERGVQQVGKKLWVG